MARSHDDTGQPPTRYSEVAQPLLQNGYAPLPIPTGTKKAAVKQWQRFSHALPSTAQVNQWTEKCSAFGAAIVCGPCVAVDIDILDEALADKAEAIVRRLILGDPLKRIGKHPKRVLLYRVCQPVKSRHIGGIADLLGVGSYVMAFGIHPDTQMPYQWVNGSPLDRRLNDLPIVTELQMSRVYAALAELRAPATPQGVTHPNSAAPDPGKVQDHRDIHLTKLIWHVWAAGETDAEVIADQAFSKFSETTDLARAKRNGTEPWTRADALTKAQQLVARNKVRPTASTGLGHGAIETQHQAFTAAVYRVAAHGKLPPAAVAVSTYMLSHAKGPQGCFASPQTIADALNLALETVKRARRRLIELELWTRPGHVNGRGHLAYYFPNLQFAGAIAEKVTKLCTRNSREGVEDHPLATEKNNKIQQNIDEALKSIGIFKHDASSC